MTPKQDVLGLTSACMQSTIVFYDILSALFFNLCTYAALIYDCSSVLHIKESVEHLYDDWDSYKKTFPPTIWVLLFLTGLLLAPYEMCLRQS